MVQVRARTLHGQDPQKSEFKINIATASKSVRESGSLVPVAEHEWRSEGRQMKTAFRGFFCLQDKLQPAARFAIDREGRDVRAWAVSCNPVDLLISHASFQELPFLRACLQADFPSAIEPAALHAKQHGAC